MPDEAQLVRRCQQGDLRAFADLVEQYQDRLFDVAWAILREREAAKDAVQETFLTTFQKIEGFRGESALATWLIAIVVNQCRARLRRQKMRRLLSLDSLSPQRLLAAGKQNSDPAAIVGRRLQQEALWQLWISWMTGCGCRFCCTIAMASLARRLLARWAWRKTLFTNG